MNSLTPLHIYIGKMFAFYICWKKSKIIPFDFWFFFRSVRETLDWLKKVIHSIANHVGDAKKGEKLQNLMNSLNSVQGTDTDEKM